MSSRGHGETADPRARNKKELGKRIRTVRLAQPPRRPGSDHLSQTDFGKLFDPHKNRETISNWERGQEPRSQSRRQLAALAKGQYPPDYFALRSARDSSPDPEVEELRRELAAHQAETRAEFAAIHNELRQLRAQSDDDSLPRSASA